MVIIHCESHSMNLRRMLKLDIFSSSIKENKMVYTIKKHSYEILIFSPPMEQLKPPSHFPTNKNSWIHET